MLLMRNSARTIISSSGTFIQATIPTSPSVLSGSSALIMQASFQAAVSGITIPDIQLRAGGTVPTIAFTTTAIFTVPSTVQVGDLMTVYAGASSGSITAPAGWTLIGSDSTNFATGWWYRVATSGDTGGSTTYTWTGTGANGLYSVWFSLSGGTVSIDVSNVGSAVSGTSATVPAVTTTAANEILVTAAVQAGGNPIALPTTEAIVSNTVINFKSGFYFQAVAGLSATQTYTASNTGAWEIAQIGLKTTTGSSTSWSTAGSLLTAGSLSQQLYSKPASSDQGTVYLTWTTSAVAEVLILEWYSTQGTAPTFATPVTSHATASSAAWPTPTLTQNSQMVLEFITRPTTGSWAVSNPTSTTGGPIIVWNYETAVVANSGIYSAYFGCATTTLPTMPTAQFGSSVAYLASTTLVTEATGGDAIVTGVSVPDNTAATNNTSTKGYIPVTSRVGDVLVGVIAQTGAKSVFMLDPYENATQNAVPGTTITIPASVAVGDLLITIFASFDTGSFVISPPAGWTQIQNNNATGSHSACGAWYRIATSGDLGGSVTYTWTVSPGDNLAMWAGYFKSNNGGSLSIDTSAIATSTAASFNSPVITTSTVSEYIITAVGQTISTPTNPNGTALLTTIGSGLQVAWFPQVPVGTIPNKTWTGGSGTSNVMTIAIKSSTPNAPFTLARSDTTAPSDLSTSLWWRKYTTGDPAFFTWSVGTTVSTLQAQVVSVGNVDGSNPIDGNNGFANTHCNQITLAVPKAVGVTANTGLLLYVGCLGGGLAGGGGYFYYVGPASSIADTYLPNKQNNNSYGPSRLMVIGYGSPDMSYTSHDITTDGAASFTGQTLALKGSNTPVRSTTNIRVQQLGIMVMYGLNTALPPDHGPKPKPITKKTYFGVKDNRWLYYNRLPINYELYSSAAAGSSPINLFLILNETGGFLDAIKTLISSTGHGTGSIAESSSAGIKASESGTGGFSDSISKISTSTTEHGTGSLSDAITKINTAELVSASGSFSGSAFASKITSLLLSGTSSFGDSTAFHNSVSSLEHGAGGFSASQQISLLQSLVLGSHGAINNSVALKIADIINGTGALPVHVSAADIISTAVAGHGNIISAAFVGSIVFIHLNLSALGSIQSVLSLSASELTQLFSHGSFIASLSKSLAAIFTGHGNITDLLTLTSSVQFSGHGNIAESISEVSSIASLLHATGTINASAFLQKHIFTVISASGQILSHATTAKAIFMLLNGIATQEELATIRLSMETLAGQGATIEQLVAGILPIIVSLNGVSDMVASMFIRGFALILYMELNGLLPLYLELDQE